MDAIVHEIKRWESAEFRVDSSHVFSRGVNPGSKRRCPHCDSIIYSRRHRLCGVCAQALPEQCLFTVDEAKSVRSLLDQERRRHRQWLHRFRD